MLITIILSLTMIFFIWKLIAQGLIWKIIVGVFGWIGMYAAIIQFAPKLDKLYLTIGSNKISWSMLVPSFILVMAMLYTEND